MQTIQAGEQSVTLKILNDGETEAYHLNVIRHLEKCAGAHADQIRDYEDSIRKSERDLKEINRQLENARRAYQNATDTD